MIKIGCDPEFFLYSEKHDAFVSAHDLVPGTKEDPYRLEKGAVQADGTAVEFNIDPATTDKEFSDNILTVLTQIRDMIDPKLKFRFLPSVRYKPEYFAELPDVSKELGCTPDFNAYNEGKPNEKPDNKTTMRTGAGHIHIGFTEDKDPFDKSHLWDCCEVVKALDNVYGNIEPVFDTDKDRRRMYGAKGAFRPKHYGVEYRVPSNAWVKYPGLHKVMFSMSKTTIETLKEGRNVYPSYNPEAYIRKLSPAWDKETLFAA